MFIEKNTKLDFPFHDFKTVERSTQSSCKYFIFPIKISFKDKMF